MKNLKIKTIIINTLVIITLIIIMLLIVYNILYTINNALFKSSNSNLFNTYVITDNLMSPALNKYDLVFIKKYKNEQVRENDIIVFYTNGNLNISRVKRLGKININTKYTTKRDSNYQYDVNEVTIKDIEGKVNIRIPKGGILVFIAQSKILTVLIIILMILLLIRNIRLKKRSFIRKEKLEKYKEKNNHS
ncbi:MAG: S26 family signal peptidase [Clostridia bacterium]|nr:S26 family signal peptidase [Clostridia bacterium]